jgi:hypothetical protein
VFYYIQAEATNGKQQVRPMPAPEGYWKFKVSEELTGIQEQGLMVTVYPNPSSGKFRIRLGSQIDATFSVLDMSGKRVEKGSVSSEFLNLDLTEKVSGLYLFRLEWEGGQKSVRLHVLD